MRACLQWTKEFFPQALLPGQDCLVFFPSLETAIMKKTHRKQPVSRTPCTLRPPPLVPRPRPCWSPCSTCRGLQRERNKSSCLYKWVRKKNKPPFLQPEAAPSITKSIINFPTRAGIRILSFAFFFTAASWRCGLHKEIDIKVFACTLKQRIRI